MRNWWNGLNAREHILLLIAGGLTLVICLYQFVFVPLKSSREAAESRYIRMVGDVRETLQGIDQLKQMQDLSQTAANPSSESLELLLSRSASARGLEIVRLQPSGPGELTVWFENAPPQVLMNWIFERQQADGVHVKKADLRKRDDESGLRGNVEFTRGAVE